MSARELQTALRRLVGADAGYQTLEAEPDVGAQPGGVSVGHPGSGGASAEGGITLAEESYLLREYWPPETLTSSDGLFVLTYDPIRSITMEDGSRFTFAEPTE